MFNGLLLSGSTDCVYSLLDVTAVGVLHAGSRPFRCTRCCSMVSASASSILGLLLLSVGARVSLILGGWLTQAGCRAVRFPDLWVREQAYPGWW